MKFAKLASLSDEGLVHKELQLERDLIAATFRMRTGQLEDSSSLAKLRRDLARTRTAQRERELAAGLDRNALREKHRNSFVVGAPQAESVAPTGGGFLKGIASKLGIGSSDSAETAQDSGAE